MSDLTTDTEEMVVEDENVSEPDVPLVPLTEARRIRTQSADPTIRDLYNRYKENDLALDPDYQRHFVWDRIKSSRLIESVLLDVPLPIVYLAEEQDGSEEVIDGQQRLTSFFLFLDNEFALTGLEMRADLNGKRFDTLDRDLQRKLRQATLRTVTIKNDSSEDLKFEIFKRLNTGSVALNDQELRNCVYAGPYNKLLRELAADTDFMFLMGISKPETRMRDVELVLRFAAFYHSTYLNYRAPVKRFLNEEMKTHRNLSPGQADILRVAFKNSVQSIRSLLGTSAFKRYYRGSEGNHSGYWSRPRHDRPATSV